MAKIFLSGPIKNMPLYNKLAFKMTEEYLTEKGHSVMNPINLHPKNPLSFSADEYVHVCFAMIDICDALYFLPGWENSKGANEEKAYAEKHGKLCFYNGLLE
jgi:hypothetical protein